MDAIALALTVLGTVAAIIQTIVTLVERAERKRLQRADQPPSRSVKPSPTWRPPLESEGSARSDISAKVKPIPTTQSTFRSHCDHYQTETTPEVLPTRDYSNDDYSANVKSGLAYLFGFIGTILFWKNPSERVRFHAIQSLWIDICVVLYFLASLILTVIYVAIFYPNQSPEISSNDPVTLAWALTVLLGPPLIHITLAIFAMSGQNPRMPLIWKIAATVAARGNLGKKTSDQPLPLDPIAFGENWRSSLAYALGFLGALIFWRNSSERVRFHAAQSLWIGITAILYFILGFFILSVYGAVRYGTEDPLPENDLVMWTFMLTIFSCAPMAYLVCAVLAIMGKNPSIPVLRRVATTAATRRIKPSR